MQKPVAGWDYTVKVDATLGCEACSANYLNTEHGSYTGCAKHPVMSIDPVIASVLAAEKRRESYQQAVYELEVLGEIRNSGFSRAWKAEYASRDLSAATQRALAELDAAGIFDLDATRSTPEVAAKTIIAIIDGWIKPLDPISVAHREKATEVREDKYGYEQVGA